MFTANRGRSPVVDNPHRKMYGFTREEERELYVRRKWERDIKRRHDRHGASRPNSEGREFETAMCDDYGVFVSLDRR
ncbi:hypothetical protein EVAR_5192_1 [Eumeta japonica]|uniref:Uncharacterized protein n=1 Tax=Eumeta variegata TaxID=151549 RepID=A0A4C1V3U9_EUMVA|nr:hypothetical protein EVAR_5192_1 [Eumeta japonica]